MAAGQLYYIEAVHKDSTGDDFLKVGARQEKDQQITEITSQNTKWALIGNIWNNYFNITRADFVTIAKLTD